MKLPPLELTMPDGKPSDILSWWKLRDHSLPADPEKGRPEGLPRLARMARQYHNEPASSAGAERLFSKASRAHHDYLEGLHGRQHPGARALGAGQHRPLFVSFVVWMRV